MRRIQDTNIGAGDLFISRNPGTNTPGTKIRKDSKNDEQEEICRAIESTGEPVDTTLYIDGPGNRDQTAQMVAHYGAGGAKNYIESAGSAEDIYIIEMPDFGIRKRQWPQTLFNGMEVIFTPVEPSTGGPVTLTVEAFATKNIKTVDGLDPGENVIAANKPLTLAFNAVSGWFEIVEFGGGGQFLGNEPVKAISYNAQTIGEDITIAGDQNAFSVGVIEILDGFTVEILDGGVWLIA